MVMAVCAGCTYLFAYVAAGWLAQAGIIRNMGLVRLPTTLLSASDTKWMALLAAVGSGTLLALLLFWLPRYPLISLLGLYWPFGMLTAMAPLITDTEGVWYRGLLSGLGYLVLALGQWLVCLGAFRLLQRWQGSRLTRQRASSV